MRSRFFRLVAVLGLLAPLLGGCAPVDVLNATIPTGGLEITRDVAYGPGPRQRLDIYAPKSAAEGPPVVVFFYGGAWQEGGKRDFLFVAEALASRGMIAVLPDYRVYPEVSFPGFLDDGAAATAWVVANVRRLGGDTGRIFLAGHSAGAYIAAMLALNERYLAQAGASTAELAGAIGISGPYDFLPITRPDLKPIFEVVPDMGVTQPIRFARSDAPPMLLVAGEADVTVDPANTRRLADRIRALGGTVETRFYPGVAHIGAVLALAPLFRGKAPVLDDIDAFVHEGPR